MSKTKNRLISALTAVMVLMMSLTFIMPAVRVSAEGNWISNAADSFAGGTGTPADPYQISTARELARMANNINFSIDGGAYLNKYYKLTADIDLSGHEWEAMGTISYKFAGTFDGNEHSIKNITVSSGNYVGLFGCIGKDGCIKNVVIESGSITGSEKVAGVCAANFGGSIENCSNSATVSGFSYVGGICGLNKGTVTGCTNFANGKVKGTASSASSLSSYIGGICGYNNSEIASRDDVIVSNCNNYAEIGENLYNNASGGICGFNSGIVKDCYNDNKVSGYSKVGGVCGESQAYIKDSSNEGEVTAVLNTVGGICGAGFISTNISDPGFVIENCTNKGNVKCTNTDGSDSDAGGVCGYSQITISGCANEGNVYCPNPVVGGICGTLDGSTIIKCSNSGGISSDSTSDLSDYSYVGGVCGVSYNGSIENSYNTGNVSSKYCAVGGVCGFNCGDFDYDNGTIIESGKIKNCYNTGTISAEYANGDVYSIGGVCGYSWAGIIEGCYNTGAASGDLSIGGICGFSELSTFQNCFNTGAANGEYYIGGICGQDWFNLIEKCYSLGEVTGENGYVGSICGYINNDDYDCVYVYDYDYGIKNCYYNKDLTTVGGISGSDTDSVKGLSTIEMTCGEALAKMGFDTAEWVKKTNDKINKQAYYPNPKAFTYTPSVGYETKLTLALSDENAEYFYGDAIDFDVSALVKFDGMTDFAPDTNETPLASGKGSFTVVVGDDTVVTSTEICDNTLVSVTSSEIRTLGDAVTFTLNYDGTYSDYIYDADNADTCEVKIANGSLTADDFDFTAANDLVYDGKAKAATVKEKSGITGIGAITVKYYDPENNKLASAPNAPGTYTVKIDAAEGNNYSAAADLTANSWTFTIEKATPTVTVTAAPTSDAAGKTVTVTASAKNPNNGALDDVPAPTLTYKVGDGAETAFTGSFVIPKGTANGTIITITAKTSGNDYYNEGTGTVTVTVTDCTHTDKTTVWEKDKTGHWHICNYCGAVVDKEEHDEDSGTVTKQPTEAAEGEKTFKCKKCDWVIRTESIAKLEKTLPLPKVTATPGENSVTLKWTAVDGAKSYRVFYRVNGTTSWANKNTTTTSATITGLTGGTKYDFLVLAYDGTNWSKYTNSDIINATPNKPAAVAPAKPVFTATAGVNSISLKWNAVSNAMSYRVYYRVNGTTPWKYRNTTATAVTLTELTGGTKYDIAVRAYSGSAWSAFSTRDIVNATPLVAGNKPVFSSVTPGVNRAILRWNAVDGAKSYCVFYRVSGTTKWYYKNTTLTAMNLTGLEGGKTYEFVVRSYDGKTWSSYTSEDIVKAAIKS